MVLGQLDADTPWIREWGDREDIHLNGVGQESGSRGQETHLLAHRGQDAAAVIEVERTFTLICCI